MQMHVIACVGFIDRRPERPLLERGLRSIYPGYPGMGDEIGQ